MNLNESELEQQLRQLRPRPASAALEERIALALDQRELSLAERVPTAAIIRRARPVSSGWTKWLQGLGWALAGAAGAVAVIALARHGETRPSPMPEVALAAPAATFEPTESTQEIVNAEDEGVLLDSDQEPVRQVRYHSLE